jgi:membrane-associated PAP2 superfamily phosphatase
MGASRREWSSELALLIALAVLSTIIFAASSLDIATLQGFYRADVTDHWPLAKRLPWSAIYQLASVITASLVAIGLAAVIVGWARRRAMWRRYGVFLLLALALGPGLVVNAVFKSHWDRPRPRDIVEFGGSLHYAPAPLRGEGGKSFPCGHCSVGYMCGVGWWVWRRRRPALAGASLALGLGAGFILGLGRMAAGGHFLSDVVWSGILVYGVVHILYHYVLRIPEHERYDAGALAAQPLLTPVMRRVLATVGGAGVLAVLFATPHGTRISTAIQLPALPEVPRAFEVDARSASIDIVIVDSPATQVAIDGELHGFGLPTSRLGMRVEFASAPAPTLRYRIEQRGWFSDLDGSLSMKVPAGLLERISVRIQRGNIRVRDMTRAAVVESGKLKLDLRTASGRVQSPGSESGTNQLGRGAAH